MDKPKRKSVSMAKVARTYKKNTKQVDQGWNGARFFNEGAKSQGMGGATRKNTYKPKPARGVFGGESSTGKGQTKVVKAVKALKKGK